LFCRKVQTKRGKYCLLLVFETIFKTSQWNMVSKTK